MKIGIYSPYLDTLTGGEFYMLTIAEFLSEKHDVDIFWNDKEILNKGSRRFNLNLDRVNLVKDIFLESLSSKEKFIKTLKYDRIIFLSDGSIPFLYPKKLILHFQEPFLSKNVPFLEKSKAFSARKVICNSKFTKEYIDKTFGVNSIVLYPPVQKIKLVNKRRENVILTVGRYQPYEDGTDFKKISFMIDMFKKLYLENKEWKFKIITSVKSEYESNFEKNILSKIDNSIEIIKNADFETVQSSYVGSKIYWHAAGFGEDIDQKPQRAEHFGISTVEAMSAGSVPVVINLGGQKEIIEDKYNGFLWENQNELLNYTKQLMNDDELLNNMRENALKIIKKFSKEKFCKDLSDII